MSGRSDKADALRSERLTAALDRAIAAEGEGDADLFDLLLRSSGLPGPSANHDLARAIGAAIAARGSKGERLVRALVQSEDEYLRIVAAMAFAALSLPGPKPGATRARVAQALADLQELAEDPRHIVRGGIVSALRVRLAALGEAAVVDLAAWTDGYLQAHVALEAMADRQWLTTQASPVEILARLDEAFVLADASPRSAERTQGMRTLRQGMPAQIVAFVARYPEALAWLEGKTASARPETREILEGAVRLLRRTVLSDVEAGRFTALLEASAKPRRDADRVVHGTRRRGRGRT